jgi:predicted outer membrane protein
MIAARSSRRLTRWFVGITATVLTSLATPVAAQAADVPVPVPSIDGLSDKGKGAITAADRDFVVKVRLAGLWEVPAGNMAQEKSEDPRVRAIGKAIAEQHVTLDKLDVAAAKQLGIALPVQPTAQQQGWLAEMQNATGARFDQIFVDRLRAAHGKIFPVIGAVRSGTRNETVRTLAEQANGFVQTHMTLLESTGLVRYAELPPVVVPAPQDQSLAANAKANAEFGTGLNTTVIWAVLLGALALGGVATVQVFRGK